MLAQSISSKNMATITFNPPMGISESLNVALSDGRYIRLEKGTNTYPDDATFLLKKSRNPAVRAYITNMNIVIQIDESEGVKSVLMGNSVTPFAPITAQDLGFNPNSNINMDGFGGGYHPLNSSHASQMITPTRIPMTDEPGAPTGTDPRLVAQQQALLKTGEAGENYGLQQSFGDTIPAYPPTATPASAPAPIEPTSAQLINEPAAVAQPDSSQEPEADAPAKQTKTKTRRLK
jgi:hypothetical protein